MFNIWRPNQHIFASLQWVTYITLQQILSPPPPPKKKREKNEKENVKKEKNTYNKFVTINYIRWFPVIATRRYSTSRQAWRLRYFWYFPNYVSRQLYWQTVSVQRKEVSLYVCIWHCRQCQVNYYTSKTFLSIVYINFIVFSCFRYIVNLSIYSVHYIKYCGCTFNPLPCKIILEKHTNTLEKS